MKVIPVVDHLRKHELTCLSYVDDDDYCRLRVYSWSLVSLYAAGSGGPMHRVIARMHSEIYGDIDGFIIDHKDHNTLNNTKANLRKATASQNGANKTIAKWRGTVGVCQVKGGRWRAYIGHNGKRINLGTFGTKEEALAARDAAAAKLHGEFAALNEDVQREQLKRLRAIERKSRAGR